MNYASALSVFIYSGCLFLIIVLFRLLWTPIKFVLKFLVRSAFGCSMIVLINTLFSQSAFQIAINLITAIICGFFGIGGVLFLAMFNIFL